MLSVDTNVIVRFLTKDDPDQSPRARDLIIQNDIWLGVTVVLETEWVLRSIFRYAPAEFVKAMRSLAGMPRLEIENDAAVEQALRLHDQGMDFSDALHLATAEHCEAFVTFDRDCIDLASRLCLTVRAP
jgi:predicted nucleic acid-binding protein